MEKQIINILKYTGGTPIARLFGEIPGTYNWDPNYQKLLMCSSKYWMSYFRWKPSELEGYTRIYVIQTKPGILLQRGDFGTMNSGKNYWKSAMDREMERFNLLKRN